MFASEVKALLSKLNLPDKDSFRPFPLYSDRQAWDGIPTHWKDRLAAQAAGFAAESYPQLTAALFGRYLKDGNRVEYENLYFQRRRALESFILAECAEGNGRYFKHIVDGIWLLCEESFWGVPAHNGLPAERGFDPMPDTENPYIDLFAAETALLINYALYLFGAELTAYSPRLVRRAEAELDRRIITPFKSRNDFDWMGFYEKVNNWNPWIISNLLWVLALNGEQTELKNNIIKCFECLDNYLKDYPPDGSCGEGISYYNAAGGSVFDCLELLFTITNGKINFFDRPLIKEMALFAPRMHVADEYFVNFADGSAMPQIDFYMIYRLGLRVRSENVIRLGLYGRGLLSSGNERVRSMRRLLPEILDAKFHAAEPADAPLLRDVWLPNAEIMTAREDAGSVGGLFLCAKGGNNGESHNHNDVGSFMVYLNGLPILVDAGVGVYNKKTFSAERYEIWTMQSQYHNVPTINNTLQHDGGCHRTSRAVYSCDEDKSMLEIELAGAYTGDAGLISYTREFVFNRSEGKIRICDKMIFSGAINTVLYNFISCIKPQLTGNSVIYRPREGNNAVKLSFSHQFSLNVPEHIDTSDRKLYSVWGDTGLFRLTAQSDTSSVFETVFELEIIDAAHKEGSKSQ